MTARKTAARRAGPEDGDGATGTPGPRRTGARSVLGSLGLGLVIAVAMIGCVVGRIAGPRLTGTCAGACAHYAACKPGHSDADRARCTTECPDVFSDRDSLLAYESLSCEDAVEYVDGRPAKTAGTARSR